MMEDGLTPKRGGERGKNTQVKEHQENKILHRSKGKHCLNRISIKTESTSILIKQLRVL